MSKKCAITGKTSQMGGGYSNRVRAGQFNPTGKRRRYANLQTRTYFIPELDKNVRVTVSARGIKTINKKGPYKALVEAGVITASPDAPITNAPSAPVTPSTAIAKEEVVEETPTEEAEK